MNPVIFLDFDGVLNRDEDSYHLEFEPENAKNFLDLLRRVPADIVVISSWRKKMSLEEIRKFFNANGLPGDRVISKVGDPNLPGGRGKEIDLWLDAHPDVSNYVVIDDNDTDLGRYRDCLVQPESSNGLQKKDVEKACRILIQRNG